MKDQLVKLRNKLFGVNAIITAIEELKSEISSNKGLIVEKEKVNKTLISPLEEKSNKSLVPPLDMIFVGGGDYEEVGNDYKNYFIEQGGLKQNDKVLEIGCGIGRMARPLTNYLSDEGEYQGFDIVKMGIDWCKETYADQYPNFNFELADVYNKHYNPTGKYTAKDYKFIYENSYFDFVFLTSVFTHMLPLDMENYTREIVRVLKPGGTCFITFFLINPEAVELMQTYPVLENFSKEIEQGCFVVDEEDPEAVIAYDEELIREIYKNYGLEIQGQIYYGRWCGRKDFLSYQDIIVAKKLKTELKPESLALNSQFCQEILPIPSQDSMESLKLPSESTKFNGWQFNKIIQDWINLQTKYPDRFNSVIDEKDEMYTYLLNLYHGNNGQAILEYLSTGQQSMNVIKQICEWGFHGFQNISTFLDFASGYGRLTRFLVQELSPEKIWIADIYTDAVKFQEEQFGVHCITSVNSPTEFNVDMKYDCIFVGSLFSHLPPESFFEWLRKLYDLLSSNGILIFSVHDSAVSPDNLQIGEEGFLFLQHSESATLDKNEYGTMYVNEFFVGEAIKSVTGNLNFFRKPRGLWGFQDIYIVGKNSSNRFEDLNISSGSMGYLDRCYVTEEKELIFEGWAVESDKLLRLEDIQIFINNNLVDHCLPCYDRPDVAIAYQNDNFLRSGFRCCVPRAEFDFELSDIVCVKTINSQKIEKILRISTLGDLLTIMM